MMTTAAVQQPARGSRRAAWGSALAGIVALVVLVYPVLMRLTEGEIQIIVARPVKVVQASGLLPLVGVGVLVLAVGAIVLGFVANPRVHWLAIIGLVTGAATLILLVISIVLSYLQGALWLIGSSFTPHP